ncbi:histidine-type phosphatase [uncultured Sphingomonas sp.]|uniref:histidine-type phosphatase n=1 Tax=uncultured Sphingomonas sp. TaxID=158754 RepID=UPI0025CBBA66|nr:histidine-type phosphatase [uncultured Sphingomonas sp.]
MSLSPFWMLPALAGLLCTATPGLARPQPSTERVILLMRHGVRSPLDGEVPAGTRTRHPWPRWTAPAEQVTPHGAAALRALAQADRRWLATAGVLPIQGCPAPESLRIWTNSSPRTIASGTYYAQGFAPGCALAVGHKPVGTTDALFEPLNLHPPRFDAGKAVESIQRYTGGAGALTERHRAGLAMLERVLACPATPCSPAAPSAVAASADGHGIDLAGPIRAASGTAQVLMLQYLEGLPMAQVGWGRVSPATLAQLGAVHGALFDVFSRPPYMAAFQMAPTVDRITHDLIDDHAPAFDLLVGHDTNVAALAAVLGVAVQAPGFAENDPSPGGGIAIALIRAPDGTKAVRLWYRSQSAADIRTARASAAWIPLRLAGCDEGAEHRCPLPRFLKRLEIATAAAR